MNILMVIAIKKKRAHLQIKFKCFIVTKEPAKTDATNTYNINARVMVLTYNFLRLLWTAQSQVYTGSILTSGKK